MTKKFEKTYHVSRNHKLAAPMMGMLVEKLSDTGWTMTLSKVSNLFSYTTPKGDNHILGKTTDLDNSRSISYTIDDRVVPLTQWLNAEVKISQARCIFDGTYNLSEVKWRQAGTDNEISFLATDAGVFVSAYGDKGLHSMVSEYYVETDKPGILFSATVDGDLWELVEDDEE